MLPLDLIAGIQARGVCRCSPVAMACGDVLEETVGQLAAMGAWSPGAFPGRSEPSVVMARLHAERAPGALLACEAMADGDADRFALASEVELPAGAGCVARGHRDGERTTRRRPIASVRSSRGSDPGAMAHDLTASPATTPHPRSAVRSSRGLPRAGRSPRGTSRSPRTCRSTRVRGSTTSGRSDGFAWSRRDQATDWATRGGDRHPPRGAVTPEPCFLLHFPVVSRRHTVC